VDDSSIDCDLCIIQEIHSHIKGTRYTWLYALLCRT